MNERKHMRKKDVLKSVGRRILAMALSAALGLSLIGCGSEGEQETPKKEWAYVPEFLTLDAEEVSFWDMKAVGDYLYYSSYTYDEETGRRSEYLQVLFGGPTNDNGVVGMAGGCTGRKRHK